MTQIAFSLEMTDKTRLLLQIKNGRRIVVNYWMMALWHIALSQRSNGTQNTVSNFFCGWLGTAKISNPGLISNKAATKQKTCDFGCMSRLKRITPKVWRKILPTYLKSLYKCMLKLMKAVIDAQGGNAMYWTYFAIILCIIY